MATATGAADGAGLSGNYLIGTFSGVSEGQFPKLLVDVTRPGPDGPITRRTELGFRAFDQHTGDATPVGKGLQAAVPGDRVAVGLYPRVCEFTRKKDDQYGGKRAGELDHFIAYDAASLDVLGR